MQPTLYLFDIIIRYVFLIEVFLRLNDGQMALSKLNYDEEWYYNMTTESGPIPPQSLPLPVGQHAVDLQSESVQSPSSSQLDDVLLSSNSAPTFIVDRATECATEKELPLGMSGHSSSEPNNFPSIASHYDLDRYNENMRICKEFGFKPPVHYKLFEKLKWNYVTTFNVNNLQTGQKFTTLGELSLIPRKYNVAFCRPGPVRREEKYHWYLVDSIVQQVNVKTIRYPYFVVRWVGYEDV